MFRTKPRLSYCGLTLVLSNVSRFDSVSLLSGPAGHVMNMFALRPEYNTMMCDVRLADDKSPWLENTKCILLLGEYALHTLVAESRSNSLNELRGSVFYVNSIPAIASYTAQDCADSRAYEQSLNPLSKEFREDDEYRDDDAEGQEELKTFSRTKRSNFAFWLRADIRKAKTILQNKIPTSEIQPKYIIFPR